MARVVDFGPTSDDEGLDFDLSPRKLSSKNIKPPAPQMESPRRQLVPKSASKSVNRKVRKLETNPGITGSLLFQRCNEAADKDFESSLLRGSPRRRSPAKNNGHTRPHNDSIFESEDDSPPPTVRKSRASKLRPIPILEDEESELESQLSITMNPLLQTQTPGLRRVQLASPRKENSKQRPKTIGRSKEASKELGMFGLEIDPTIPASLEIQKKDERLHVVHEEDDSTDRSAEGLSYSTDSFNSDSTWGELSHSTDKGSKIDSTSAIELGDVPQAPANNAISGNRVLEPVQANKDDSILTPVSEEGAKLPCTHVSGTEGFTEKSPAKVHGSSDDAELTRYFSKLQLGYKDASNTENEPPSHDASASTPPRTPQKAEITNGLASPVKLARIPSTPHRPSTDAFWSQDVTDGWNDQYSPRKVMPPAVPKSPVKMSPGKAARKAFDHEKHEIARNFLLELDLQITKGQIAELAESTGGVKLEWSKSLNTTAGRANWRRETIRTKTTDGTETSVKHKHYASIELAEKVIDDENRLLNVLAHEFCHLANFMVTGISNNPHGKEFKVWASKCTRTFGSRDVKVTTKHTYEIDFKYIWQCSDCGHDYKRHSKSIDPQRHKCGSCKGMLKQIKPVPRGSAKPSEYQLFVKEHMKTVKQDNPGCPQKEIMKLVAAKWASRPKQVALPADGVEDQAEVEAQLAADMGGLTL